jgi:hypothetical protein
MDQVIHSYSQLSLLDQPVDEAILRLGHALTNGYTVNISPAEGRAFLDRLDPKESTNPNKRLVDWLDERDPDWFGKVSLDEFHRLVLEFKSRHQ